METQKIVTMDGVLAVGLPYLGKNEHGEIGEMWAVFNRRMGEIKHIAPSPKGAYGIETPNPQGLVDYVAAVPVTSLDDVPAGMVTTVVPAQTYVVVEAHGLRDIMAAFDRILKQWLPSSGYAPSDGPCFECYPPTWENDMSILYIYYPVKKK